MKKIIAPFIISFSFFACAPSAPDTDDSLPQVVKENIVDTLNVIEPTTPSKEVALNPPHGQPGHDCNIEVGAPLINSPTSQPVMRMMPQPSNQRINPPHGEPGHDCNVQVGSPLP